MTVIYKKIISNEDMEKLQKILDRLGEWVVENAIKQIPVKLKHFPSREPGQSIH